MDESGWVKRRFTSYNDFFMRKLKPGQRPVEEDTARIISPCDAKLTVCPITDYGIMKIKHTPYTVKELLKSEKLARAYEGGYGFVYRLTVDDYHRYIYTETGKKSGNYKIPGIFHTVNPIANDLEPIYKENTREFCLIRTTDAGTVLQMEVGALMVGKIENDQEEAFVHRGEEKGRFAFGGSTIVVLYQRGPTLLLHSCCAPCSSYCLETLSEDFAITVFYYNPNIYPEDEYWKRVREQERFIGLLPAKHKISFLEGNYEKERFYETVKGLEKIPEGGERCFACYRLRLSEAIKEAEKGGFDYVTTTLTISPMKNAQKLNEIGEELCRETKVAWLPSDFKKKNGYKRSTELSKEYGMYRQDYCGCVFSMREREEQKARIEQEILQNNGI